MTNKVCIVDKVTYKGKILYAWHGINSTCCIMAVHKGYSITGFTLKNLSRDNTISNEEYDAIQKLDGMNGLKDDLKTIQKLAKRLDITLEIRDQVLLQHE